MLLDPNPNLAVHCRLQATNTGEMVHHMSIHYRDRISVMTWAALFILAAGSLIPWPERAITWQALGSPVTLRLDESIILAILLVVVAASGTDAVLRSHPLALQGRLPRTWPHWGLPSSIVVVAALLTPALPSPVYTVGAILVAGVMLAVAEVGAYHTIDPWDPHYRLARIALNAVAYAATLALFLLVYRTRARSLVSATLVTVIGALLALELLRGQQRLADAALFAVITGILLGEATWALNYWRPAGYTPSLILLLIFYEVVGLGQQSLLGRLTSRVLWEYGVVALAGVITILMITP